MLYTQCFYGKGEPIIAQGYFNGDRLDINMSSIFTRLIQEAGRFCDRYASDLIIEIDSLREQMQKHNNAIRLIGFRENGVDHTQWVLYKEPADLKGEYRSIWKIDMKFAPLRMSAYEVTIALQQVEYSTSDHFFEKAKQGDK